MKKNALRLGISLAVVLVIFSVVAFAVPFAKSAVFWVSYYFGVIAVVAQSYTLYQTFFREQQAKSRFYGFPILRIGLIYMVVQLIASLIFMALASIAPLWLPIVVDIMLLGVAVIGLIAADVTKDEIQRQEQTVKKDTSTMRELQSKVRMLVSQCEEPQLKADVSRLSEALQYSDPVSSEALGEIEQELREYIGELQKAVSERQVPAARTLCQRTMDVLAERNRLCKLNK